MSRSRHNHCLHFGLGALEVMQVPKITISYSKTRKYLHKVRGSKDTADFVRTLFPKGSINLYESIVVVYLNHANDVIGYYLHSHGGITGTVADPRLILATALLSASTKIILAHNHPTGNLKPSEADENMTRMLGLSANIMQIELLDHFIITKGGYYSFSEEGKIRF